MAVLAILVTMAVPYLFGFTREASMTKLLNDAKVLEDGIHRYYHDHGDWPRATEKEVTINTDMTGWILLNANGDEFTYDPETMNFYDLDMSKLTDYVRINSDPLNYVLGNPVGSLFTIKPETNTRLAGIAQPPVQTNFGPGPQELIAGDMTAGFFGEVPSSGFITGAELSNAIGLTAGTLQ